MEKLINTKTILSLTLTLISLFFLGCSDDGGGSKSSKDACSANPYYNTYDNQWYRSYNDLTICNPLPVTQNGNCRNGEVIVRSPYAYGNNQNNFAQSNVNVNVNVNINYHQTRNAYREICMAPFGAGWDYVVNAGGYYYVDYWRLNNAYNNMGYYGNAGVVNTGYVNAGIVYPVNPLQTVIALGVLAAIFALN